MRVTVLEETKRLMCPCDELKRLSNELLKRDNY